MCLPEARIGSVRSRWQRLRDFLFGASLPILYCPKCDGVLEDSPSKPRCCRSYRVCQGSMGPEYGNRCMTLLVVWS